jgi:hypothetical protein
MGVFDFFKSKKTDGNSFQIEEQRLSMPTIKPEQSLFECYDEVYNSMIKDIIGLSLSEAREILGIIKKCDGGAFLI